MVKISQAVMKQESCTWGKCSNEAFYNGLLSKIGISIPAENFQVDLFSDITIKIVA